MAELLHPVSIYSYLYLQEKGDLLKDMEISLIFKIAAVGILVTILGHVLKHSGREEHAFLISLAGLIVVLSWILPYIYELFQSIQNLFQL